MASKCSKKINVSFEGILSVADDGQLILEVEDYGVVDVAEKVAFMDGEKVKVTFAISEELL